MELKPYQKTVIEDLNSYIEKLQITNDISEAFALHWHNKGLQVGVLPTQMPSYKNNVPKVPNICLKVPTAGGKTFIACNALKTIFSIVPEGKPKAVVWLVPSVTILDQTLNNLRNSDNPYRQKINTHFNGRVEVYDKNQLLQGANFNSTTVKEQLSIFVLSFDTFRSRKKEDRKIYEENGNLANFVDDYSDRDSLVAGIDETSLMQVINQLNPVCIVDESHNAETDLSIEMLKNLNPSFILDLTATPRENSNIISFVDAFQLKKEHMVKLPVIVYNHKDKESVVTDALQLQKNLEENAKEEEKTSGKYIRPIVLFQAKPKNSSDTTTFEKVKQQLIEIGVPQEQIAIKTAYINEIKNIDLLSKDCEIRFIITINALKEGWDCPFAYILASLANKSSAVDVEQILGRILRQPYVKEHKNPFLNLSYVFTASTAFQETLENIVKGLQKSGFSKDDYRVIEEVEEKQSPEEVIKQDLFGGMEEQEKKTMLDTTAISLPSDNDVGSENLQKIQDKAIEESKAFEKEVENSDDTFSEIPSNIREHMKANTIKSAYEETANSIKIPQFVINQEMNDLFSDDTSKILLESNNLLNDFRLQSADININFEDTESSTYEVDVSETENNPTFSRTDRRINKLLLDHILRLPEERQISNIASIIVRGMGRISDSLSDSDVLAYVERVLKIIDKDKINDCIEDTAKYSKKIKEKIKILTEKYASEQFYKMLDADTISVEESYSFPKELVPPNSPASIIKSLYSEEGDINTLEWKVIDAVANLENVLFWHRNPSRKGFYINGFINHYPDFIVQTKSGKIIIIETKGDDRDNSDSAKKLKLSRFWANKSGEFFKYFMVFDQNPIEGEGAYTLSEFIEVTKEL